MVGDQWYYVTRGQRVGPVSLEELKRLAAARVLGGTRPCLDRGHDGLGTCTRDSPSLYGH